MLKDKYHALSSREQLIIKLATPLVLILIAWLVLIKPIIDTQAKLNKSIANKEQQLTWMKNNAGNLQSSPSAAMSITSTSQLRQLMNQLLQVHKITVERIQNINNNAVSYLFNNSQFDDVLRLVKDLQEMGVTTSQLQISSAKTPGRVNSRLTVTLGN
mgnify:CR=1 FL=1